VAAILLADTDRVVEALENTSLVALCVGQQGLQAVVPLLAQAVQQKHAQATSPLDVIIAENMRNADVFLKSEIAKHLPPDFPLDAWLGLVETSIGKMVPLMSQQDMEEDALQVFAEPYNSLIVSRPGFKNPIPDVPALAPKNNIKAWVDRKLFIHNLGHAAAAYFGFQYEPQARYIYQVLARQEVYQRTQLAMQQSADVLLALYPDEFSKDHLTAHIDDLLQRFQNRALGDTVFRVGCDLYRKLGPNDRLVAPLKAAQKLGLPHQHIYDAICAGIHFKATNEQGQYWADDLRFFEEAAQGEAHVLQAVCHL
jgi:mannitol-1-phosphate 5-dehydrogenase